MKKILCIILALILVTSSTVVFANNGKGHGSNGKGNDKKYYDKYEDYNKSLNALRELLKNHNKEHYNNYDEWQDIFDENSQEYTDEIINKILNLKDKNNDDSTSIFVNGKEYSYNEEPVIKYKNYQLPTKPITEGLGANLNWNEKTHIIQIIKGNITLIMNLGTKKVTINGFEIKTSVLTTSKKNKTIVMIKFISEVLGNSAKIDEGAGAVIVEENGSTIVNDNITGNGLNQFEYSSKWNYGTQANAYLEDNHWSSSSDAYYKVRFNGTKIKLYGATSPNHGIAAVSIDNGAETYVDLYTNTREDNVLIYTSPVLSQEQHTLKVRVTGSRNYSSSGNSITADRVSIFTSSTTQEGNNLALNKNAFSDSQQTQNTAYMGNDGNTSTRWCAADGSFNHWWTVDLGAAYNISGSQVTWENTGKLYKYKVEVSKDNSNWTLKADKTTNTSTQQIQTDSYSANDVRYVRISITGMESGCWASFSEFKVFGVSVNTNDTQAPTVPVNLTATPVSANQINLSWTASTDNVGIGGYRIYRNSNLVGTVATTNNYSDTGLTANTSYSYTVLTYDTSGNCSVQCLPVVASTKQLSSYNLALGKTVTTDSEENGNLATKGNDGNLTTRWCAYDGGFNHWWKVDLGSNYNLTGTEVNWEKNKAYKYKIEVSTDGSNWTLAVDKTKNTTALQTQTDSFTANAVRYVRITVTGFDSGCWASFNEFKVF